MFRDNSDKKEQLHKNYTKLTSAQFSQLYDVEKTLGQGTFAKVHKAINHQGLQVAIKEFNANVNKGPKHFEQVLMEVDNLKALQHPNIARFYDCYIVDQNKYYVVIEYCPGGSLTQFLAQQKLAEYDYLIICKQIADGLAFAHSKKIVHRDLKPQNILMAKGHIAKIGDFGCSKSVLQEGEQDSVLYTKIGSAAYMDKRVIDGTAYDLTVDIYALGMVFYAIFKGRGLFDRCKNEGELRQLRNYIYQNYQANIVPYIQDLPLIIQKIVINCLQQDHKSRYSAAQIAEMLQKWLQVMKPSLSKMLSTVDTQQIQDQSSLFAVGLFNYYKKIDKLQQNLSTRQRLFELLNQYKVKISNFKMIEFMKYIPVRTKKLLTIFVLFYYNFWLNSMRSVLRKKKTPFNAKYPEIIIKTLEESVLERADQYISNQLNTYRAVFIQTCREINQTLHLMGGNQYIPLLLKKIIKTVSTGDHYPYQQQDDYQIVTELLIFYEKRVVHDYILHKGKNEDAQSQNSIKTLKTLLQSL